MREPRERPRIGVMIGDPGGVGPEVCVRALASGKTRALGTIVLIGGEEVVISAAKVVGCTLEVRRVEAVEDADDFDGIAVLDTGDLAPGDWGYGVASPSSGRAVKAWIDRAEADARSGRLDGWIMAPVNTDSLKSAGVITHMDDLQPANTFMIRLSGPLRVVPIAEHLRLKEVAASVTQARIIEVISLVSHHLKRWGMAKPRLAVAGLNPHAMFEEEDEIIAPAVAQAAADGIDVEGPIAPDTVFRQCIEGRYDAVVTMYHDQGQIAVKTAVFEGACTVYLGLPYVQMSVPHGTAYDIAGTGRAQAESMLSAMKTAFALAAGSAFMNAPAQGSPQDFVSEGIRE